MKKVTLLVFVTDAEDPRQKRDKSEESKDRNQRGKEQESTDERKGIKKST
jgi:hypothetical protein